MASRLRNHIETYSGYLNLVLFDTSRTRETARSAHNRICGFRASRVLDRELKWCDGITLPLERKRAIGPPDETQGKREGRFYQPRSFVTSGTFDALVAFLSPELEMASWVQQDDLRMSGQDVNICMLPTPQGITLRSPDGSLVNNGDDLDINVKFFDSFPTSSDWRLRPFCSLIKLKLNPLMWPSQKGNAIEENGHLKKILRIVWAELHHWCEKHKGAGRGNQDPQCCIAITCGWNELLVAAFSSGMSCLLELSARLRSLGFSVDENACLSGIGQQEPGASKGRAHLFITSISVVGHDLRIRERVHSVLDTFQQQKDEEELQRARAKADGTPRISGAELLDLATDLGHKNWRGWHEPTEAPHVICQVGCLVNPGHDKELCDLFDELAIALKKRRLLAPRGVLSFGSMDAGKRDFWSPEIRVGKGYFTPLRAAALLELIRLWVRRGGLGQEICKRQRSTRPLPLVFDCYTRLACPQIHFDRLSMGTLEDHIRVVPEEFFLDPQLKQSLGLDEAAEDSGSKNGELGRHHFLEELRNDLSRLQIPYYLSEQVLNCIIMFYWANDRSVLWDQSIELIPVVLTLREHLRTRADWWAKGQRTPVSSWEVLVEREHVRWRRDLVGRDLQYYIDFELPGLLTAFRSYFYSRHMSSYFTDEMADMNLRFRGSLHQLLSIANLILDAIVDYVMGPRACMVVIGDKASPEITSRCDVIVVHLSSLTLTNPLMLEDLSHEVGHLFVEELIDDIYDPSWRRHAWTEPRSNSAIISQIDDESSAKNFANRGKSPGVNRDIVFRKLRLAVAELDHVVFQSDLRNGSGDDSKAWIESFSDLASFLVLAYPRFSGSNHYGFHSWVESFLLRTVLSTTPVRAGEPREGAAGENAPEYDEDVVAHAVVRTALVLISLRLAEYEREPPLLDEFRAEILDLEARGEGALNMNFLRYVIRDRVVLGPSKRLNSVVATSRDWREFVDSQILVKMRWLHSQPALERAWRVYRCLVKYLGFDWSGYELSSRTGQKDSDSSYRCVFDASEGARGEGPSRFLPCIQEAFADLRGDRFGDFPRDVDNGCLLPAVFVSQWLTSQERVLVREEGIDAIKDEHQPWAAALQPASEFRAREDARLDNKEPSTVQVKSVIYQRGRVLTRSSDLRDRWNEATKTFFIRLIQMIPAWRVSILKRSSAVAHQMQSVQCEPPGDETKRRSD